MTQRDSSRVERHQFAIGGHAPESNQHAHQQSDGHAKGEHSRKSGQKQLRGLPRPAGMARHHVHHLHELRNKDYECEDDQCKQRVGENLAANMTIKDAHRQEGHSSMPAAGRMGTSSE